MKKHKVFYKKRLMRNTTPAISILITAIFILSSAVSATYSTSTTTLNTNNATPLKVTTINQPIVDVDPKVNLEETAAAAGIASEEIATPMDPWDLLLQVNLQTATGANGNTGAECTEDGLWSCRWASNIHHQYDFEGNLLKEYTVSGVSSIRDLDWDNTEELMTGGAAGSSIYGWDPVGETLEYTITGGFQARALAYNEDDDVFYCSAWADPVWVVDRDGAVVDQFDLGTTTSTYGFAYDKWSSEPRGVPYLWVFDQTSGDPDLIYQYDLSVGEFVGEAHDVGVDVGVSGGIAGGLALSEFFEPHSGFACLVGTLQAVPDTMFVYEMALTIPPEHDVGIKSINSPVSGYAGPDLPMNVTVKNYGNNTEQFNCQYEIIKCEQGEPLMSENFSGGAIPANWTTDWWKVSNSNNAGAIAPEAHVYYYDQYYGGDYYDNYIMSPKIDCSGLEKVSLTFAFAADVQSSCTIYLKYRKNETSAWKDLTPWDNPVTADFQSWYEIGCYGFGGNIGEEFQFMVQYLGYWSYYRNFYLDDTNLYACGGCAEYTGLVEDIILDKQEETDVIFPGWTPTEWQNASTENTYQEYPLHAFTIMDGDENYKNNDKWELIEMYFPYMDDVGGTDLMGVQSGPGQVFKNIKAKIRNWGQNPECCFKTHVDIAEIDLENKQTVYFEDFQTGNGYTAPAGWSKGSTPSPYAWYWYTYYNYITLPGVEAPNTRLYWYYATDAELLSPEFNTGAYGKLDFIMANEINHYTGTFELYVHIRPNPSAVWGDITPWDNPVSADAWDEWVESDASIGAGPQTQLRFSFGGYYYNLNYWYFDNVELIGYDVLDPEYSWAKCCTWIDPQTDLEIPFDDWEPEFLQYEETGTRSYLVKVETNLEDPPDGNPANDPYTMPLFLDFYHDVLVEEITSPSGGFKRGELLWSSPPHPPSGPWAFLTSSAGGGYVCDDDFEGIAKPIGNIEWWGLSLVYPWAACNPDGLNFEIIFYQGAYGAAPGAMEETFSDMIPTYVGTGLFYSGFEMFKWALDLPKQVKLDEGWVSIQSTTSPNNCWLLWASGPTGNNNMRQNGVVSTYYTNAAYNMSTGGVGPEIYIAPSTKQIRAVVGNDGTFPELGLTCYATIQEFITNCTNGTLVYSDEISGINLDEPLTGTYNCIFDNYNFAVEGTYLLTVNIPDDNDDYPKNNEYTLGVGVDATPPVSGHTLVPADPDGDNGWYVSDVEVTLAAADPSIGCDQPGSGVKEMKYKVGTGSWETLPGSMGTFTLTVADDADDLPIEYYAIDMVGNEESHNSFTIDMDQTKPDMEQVQWEAVQHEINGKMQWCVEFTCNVTDATSGMNRVVMYINEGVHEINTTPDGSIYKFLIMWSTAFETVTFTFEHYDDAGNMDFDEILGENIESTTASAKANAQPKTTIIPKTI